MSIHDLPMHPRKNRYRLIVEINTLIEPELADRLVEAFKKTAEVIILPEAIKIRRWKRWPAS